MKTQPHTPTLKEIPFTQYLRPDGQTVDIYFRVSCEYLWKAETLIGRGYRFEAEILNTGVVSLTVSDGDEDIAIQLCANGPGIERCVKALVLEAFAKAEGQS